MQKIIIERHHCTKNLKPPTHLGAILKEDYLVPLEITITDMAAKLGMSRKALSKILNENSAITQDMAYSYYPR